MKCNSPASDLQNVVCIVCAQEKIIKAPYKDSIGVVNENHDVSRYDSDTRKDQPHTLLCS